MHWPQALAGWLARWWLGRLGHPLSPILVSAVSGDSEYTPRPRPKHRCPFPSAIKLVPRPVPPDQGQIPPVRHCEVTPGTGPPLPEAFPRARRGLAGGKGDGAGGTSGERTLTWPVLSKGKEVAQDQGRLGSRPLYPFRNLLLCSQMG